MKVESGVHTELAAGSSGQISSSFTIGIRVVRNDADTWFLYVDPNGGENYGLEAMVTEVDALIIEDLILRLQQ